MKKKKKEDLPPLSSLAYKQSQSYKILNALLEWPSQLYGLNVQHLEWIGLIAL